jgi:hypothetical protein
MAPVRILMEIPPFHPQIKDAPKMEYFLSTLLEVLS